MIMDRMLVVVFDDESKGYEGKKALLQLDREGSISVYADAVVAKKPDGNVKVEQSDDSGPLGTVLGTAVGSLIGLLGGPAGVVVGATAGVFSGAAADLDNVRIGADFIDEVSKKLTPSKVAVIAEIEENRTTPVDTRMEQLGGVVFRRALSDVRETIDEQNTAAMKADLEQMKAEHAQARADRKAKIQEKMNQLETKIQTRLQKAKERREAEEKKAQAKVQVLKAKAEAAKLKAAS